MAWGVLLGAVLVLVVGLLVVRRLGSAGAVAAGLVAGLLFGALAIAVRIAHGVNPVQFSVLVADPAAWAIAVAGIAGFYLHTVALQMGSVNGATAALVAGETVVPGVMGVLALGDTSRPGLGWLALLGFVLAVGGAVAVATLGTARASGLDERPCASGDKVDGGTTPETSRPTRRPGVGHRGSSSNGFRGCE